MPASVTTSSREGCLVNKINTERTNRSSRALSLRNDLTTIARNWSGKMAAAGRISHNPNTTQQVKGDWTFIGENVGVGYTLGGLHEAFMASRLHRANILGREFNQVGVGIVVRKDKRIFVTEVFAHRTGGTQTSNTCRPALTYTTLTRPSARSGVQGQRIRITARLSDGVGSLGGKRVTFGLARSVARGITGADGVASVWVVVDGAPGSSRITASYAGDRVYAPAKVSAPFTIRWEYKLRDHDAEAIVYLNPSTRQFLIIAPGELSGIKRTSAIQMQSPIERGVTLLSFRDSAIAINGTFDLGSGSFVTAIMSSTNNYILRNT